MKRSLLLTGISGAVAFALRQELSGTYDVSGLSLIRMDDVIREQGETTWEGQLDTFRNRLMDQLTVAFRGKDTIAHLGWNTRGENHSGGLDPLNITVVDCVYQAAIAAQVRRIYMASSVHAYDFEPLIDEDVEPLKPFPDTREDVFGTAPTSLYGVSKRWMEIAGQFYAQRLGEEQKILVVRLGAVTRQDRPHDRWGRLWDSHKDLAGLLTAFIECDEAPNFWVAFGVSDNHDGRYPRPLFDTVNPYGFTPRSNAFAELAAAT